MQITHLLENSVFFKGPQPLESFILSVTHSKRGGKVGCLEEDHLMLLDLCFTVTTFDTN